MATGEKETIDERKILNVEECLKLAEDAIGCGKLGLAEKNVLKAEKLISEFKDKFINGQASVSEELLAAWYEKAYTVFDKVNQRYKSAECFYTSMLFMYNPRQGVHDLRVQRIWTNILVFEGLTIEEVGVKYEKIQILLSDLTVTAKAAEKRKLYKEAISIFFNVETTHRNLHAIFKLGPPWEENSACIPNTLWVASCFYLWGDHEQARRFCKKVLEEYAKTGNVKAFEILAKSFAATGDYEDAITNTKEALKYAKKVSDKERLNKYHDQIKKKLEERHQDWLKGTHAYKAEKHSEKTQADQTMTQSDTKRKPNRKHGRLKAIPKTKHSNNEGTLSTKQNNTMASVQKQQSKASIKKEKCISRTSSTDSLISDVSLSKATFSDSDETFIDDSEDNDGCSLSNDEEEESDETETFYNKSFRLHHNIDGNEPSAHDQLNERIKRGFSFSKSFLRGIQQSNTNKKSNAFYEEMKNENEANELLTTSPDRYKRCIIHIEGPHLAICKPIESDGLITAIEISGRSKAGQTFNEDEVVVELLNEHEEKDRRYGKVVSILNRNRHKNIEHPVFLCALDDSETHLVRPLCRTIPKINILHNEILKQFEKKKNFKIEKYRYQKNELELSSIEDINPAKRKAIVLVVVLLQWKSKQRSTYPIGAVLDILQSGMSQESGLKILNLQHKTPNLYSSSCIEDVNIVIRNYAETEYCPESKEVTKLKVFTIDPPGSTDLDDALSIEKIDGVYKVGIHISDVSHYVKKDDSIDREARERSITFYPGFRRRPRHMLPEPLSEEICSLVLNRQRHVISTYFYLTKEGIPLQNRPVEITKSIVCSSRKYTYSDIQKIINSFKTGDLVNEPEIGLLYQLAKRIRLRRLGRSMFSLSSDFEEDDDVAGDGMRTMEAHYLVEEFMLMTNAKIAELLMKTFPEIVPLRCQPPPKQEDLEKYFEAEDGIIDTVVRFQDKLESKTENESVTKPEDTSNEVTVVQKWVWDALKLNPSGNKDYILMDDIHPMQHLALINWIRIQEPAQYKCSGHLINAENEGKHYSLDTFLFYTHFTSPIRRYIDLVVHRIVTSAIENSPCPYDKSEIGQICIEINSATKRANAYKNDCKRLAKAIELRSQPRILTCFVDDISDKGVTFSSKELSRTKKQHQLPFNVLNMGYKPQVTFDNLTARKQLKTIWKRRLYDTKGISTLPSRRPRAGDVLKLCPNPMSISIPRNRWIKLVHCAIDGRMKDLEKNIDSITEIEHTMGLLDVSTENMDWKFMQPYTKFSMTYSHGQTLDIQMTAELHEGILELKPMLYDMTSNNKCCLQHTEDPVRFLSRYSIEGTSEQYTSPKNYNKIWLPITEMEAAIGTVGSDESSTINNVLIEFSGRKGRFPLLIDFCDKRNIVFGGIDVDENDEREANTDIKTHNWLCLKYCCNNKASSIGSTGRNYDTVWVAHAKVTRVVRKRKKDKLIVYFDLHQTAPGLPPEVLSGSHRYSVEVLVKSEVDKRTEHYLKKLPTTEYADSLAIRIALNNRRIPDLEHEELTLAKQLQNRDLIIPADRDVKPIPKNNVKQQIAIDNALMSRFSLIQGPPGTGKTYTGIKLVYLFTKMNKDRVENGEQRKQVLFCGPSNKSVDLVGRLMKQRLGKKFCPDFVRLYGRTIEESDFPIPGRSFITQSARMPKADKKLRDVALHNLIRETGKEYASKIRDFDKKFQRTDSVPEMDELREYIKLIRKASVAEISRHDVILCTAAVGSNPKIIVGANVLQVIIDEAGMCPEPQCMLPIIATNAKQVVLIGDHKQLRPVIKCKQASELGLKKSLFERYAESKSKEAHNVKFTMLDTQYRMRPQLCDFPSRQFYQGKLKTGKTGLWREGRILARTWPCQYNQKYPNILPHVFVDVRGEVSVLTVSAEEGNEQSRSNKAEVDQVVRIVKFLLNVKRIDSSNINIISQYNSQIHELKTAVRDINEDVEFNVNTVSASQGGEWDYVVFSTVASLPDYKIEKNPTLGWCQQKLGFITDENQINVALTRARKGLVIVGNSKLLQCDKVWKNLIQSYNRLGCLLTPKQFPPNLTRHEIMEANIQESKTLYGSETFQAGTATSFDGYSSD